MFFRKPSTSSRSLALLGRCRGNGSGPFCTDSNPKFSLFMNRHSLRSLVLAVALVVGCLVLYLVPPSSPAELAAVANSVITKPAGTNKSVPARATSSSGPAMAFNWHTGDALAYNLQTITSLGDSHKVCAGGMYHLLVLSDGAADGRVVLMTIFSAAHYETNGHGSAHMARLLEQVPCLMELEVSGKVIRYQTPDYLANADRDVIVGMNGVQVVMGTPDAARSWVVEEADAIGVAKVIYESQSPLQLTKKRRAYLSMKAQGMLPNSDLVIANSLFKAQLGETWLASYQGAEEMTFMYEGKPAWRSRTEVTLVQKQGALPALLQKLPAGLAGAAAMKLLEADRPEIVRLAGAGSVTDLDTAALRAQAYAGVTYDQIMKETEAALNSANSQAERTPAIQKLTDWLLARPEEAAKLAGYLQKAGLKSETTAGIIHALELSSASPSSQALLAAILSPEGQAHYSRDVLLQTAVAAGGVVEILDQSLMDHLYTMAFTLGDPQTADTSNSALLSLGVLAKGNPDIRERMASDLADTLNETTPGTDNYVATALQALANGGVHNEGLDAKAKELFQSSRSEVIRAEALAYISSAQSDPELARAALSDASDSIKTRAVEVITGREVLDTKSAAALTAIVTNASSSEALRSMTAQQIKRFGASHLEITTSYQQALSQNPPADLRSVLIQLSQSILR